LVQLAGSFSGLFTGTSPPLDEQPEQIVVGFLGKYRLHDFPFMICEEPNRAMVVTGLERLSKQRITRRLD
jgi:hypothetical protein